MKIDFFLAWRYLFRSRARHLSFIGLISVIGIALGVATLIVVISVMNGFDKDLMEKLMGFNDHITIEVINGSITPDLMGAIRNTDGISSVTLYAQTQVFASIDEQTIIPMVVKAVDFKNPSQKQVYSKYLISQNNSQEGLYIGWGFMTKFFIKDKLSFYPLDKKITLTSLPVKGVFKVGIYDIDNYYLLCDIDLINKLGNNYLTFIGVRVKDPFKVNQVAEKLKFLEKQGFLVRTWIETNNVLFSALKLEKFTMFIILSLIILVASFNVFASLSIKVVEKTKDIGILKALGFSNYKIMSVFSLQGLLLGFLGVFWGSCLGIFICTLLKKYHFISLPQEIYYIDYLPVYMRTKDIIIIIAIGVFLAFISSIVPAKRAANLVPSEALRYE